VLSIVIAGVLGLVAVAAHKPLAGTTAPALEHGLRLEPAKARRLAERLWLAGGLFAIVVAAAVLVATR
jgi:hypothetical protein